MVDLVGRVQSSGFTGVIATTGYGFKAIRDLVKKDNYVVAEAIYLGNSDSFHQFIGRKLTVESSDDKARLLAISAYRRSLKLKVGIKYFGLGVCVAYPWVYASVQTKYTTVSESIELDVPGCDLDAEVSKIIIRMLVKACGPLLSNAFTAKNFKSLTSTGKSSSYASLFNERITCVVKDGFPKVIFPGTFEDPTRKDLLVRINGSLLENSQVFFEFTVNPKEGLPLDFISLEQRIDKLKNYQFVVTNATELVDRIKLFPNTVCIVNSKQWKSLTAKDRLKTNLAIFKSHRIRFLVFSVDGDNLPALNYYDIAKPLPIIHNLDTEVKFEEKLVVTTGL